MVTKRGPILKRLRYYLGQMPPENLRPHKKLNAATRAVRGCRGGCVVGGRPRAPCVPPLGCCTRGIWRRFRWHGSPRVRWRPCRAGRPGRAATCAASGLLLRRLLTPRSGLPRMPAHGCGTPTTLTPSHPSASRALPPPPPRTPPGAGARARAADRPERGAGGGAGAPAARAPAAEGAAGGALEPLPHHIGRRALVPPALPCLLDAPRYPPAFRCPLPPAALSC